MILADWIANNPTGPQPNPAQPATAPTGQLIPPSAYANPQATVNGHVISISLTQWLTRRVDLQINSAYTRGASLKNNSRIEYLGGTAELQIQLQQHVLFSVQSQYVSQRGTNLPSETPLLSRYTVTSGIQFIFASLGGRRGER